MQDERRNRLIAAKLSARAWQDPKFREQLLSDPGGVMAAAGMEVPKGIEVRAVENTPTRQYIVVPCRPSWLTDNELNLTDVILPMATYYQLVPTDPPPPPPPGSKQQKLNIKLDTKRPAAKKKAKPAKPAKKAPVKEASPKKSKPKARKSSKRRK